MDALLSKLLDLVVKENGISSDISIFISGILGLIAYLFLHDFVIAAFVFLIVFPISRLMIQFVYDRFKIKKKALETKKMLDEMYRSFSANEQMVISHFVKHGGAVMRWKEMNKLDDCDVGVESLRLRGLLIPSVDLNLSETFELNIDLFTYAYKNKQQVQF